MNITICPSCGSNKIKKERKSWKGNFKGQTYNVPNLEFYKCPNCGEKVYDNKAMRKIESYSPAYKRTLAEKNSVLKHA